MIRSQIGESEAVHSLLELRKTGKRTILLQQAIVNVATFQLLSKCIFKMHHSDSILVHFWERLLNDIGNLSSTGTLPGIIRPTRIHCSLQSHIQWVCANQNFLAQRGMFACQHTFPSLPVVQVVPGILLCQEKVKDIAKCKDVHLFCFALRKILFW